MNVRFFATLAIIAATCVTLLRAADPWTERADRRKAEYLGLEALSLEADDDNEGAYELFRRSYALDSTDTYVGRSMAYLRLNMNHYIDSAELVRYHHIAERRFAEEPGDRENAFLYNFTSSSLGHPERVTEVLGVLDSIYHDNVNITLMYLDALYDRADSISYVKALNRVAELEDEYGPSAKLTAYNISAYTGLGQYDKLEPEMQRLIKLAPMDAMTYLLAARFYSTIECPDSVPVYLRKACEVEPENGDAYVELTDYYREVGDTVAYRRTLEHLLIETDLDTDDKVTILLEQIKSGFMSEIKQEDVDMMQRLSERFPSVIIFQKLYALSLVGVDRNCEAADVYQQVIDLDPTDEYAAVALVQLRLDAEQYEQAVEDARSGLARFPNNIDLLYYEAATLILLDRGIEILDVFSQFVDNVDIEALSAEEGTRLAGIMDIGASVAFNYEDKERCIKFCEIGYKLDHENPELCNNYAYFLAEWGENLELAKQLSYYSLLCEPDKIAYLDTYAWVLYKMSDFEGALEYINKMLSQPYEEEPNATYLSHGGDIYFCNGYVDEAIQLWEVGLTIDPDDQQLRQKVENIKELKESLAQ